MHCELGNCKVCDSCDSCDEVCLEFLMYGTGPAAHGESFDKHNKFGCSGLFNTATQFSDEEFESESLHKQSCKIVTDQGHEVNFRVAEDTPSYEFSNTFYKVDTCHNTSVRKM